MSINRMKSCIGAKWIKGHNVVLTKTQKKKKKLSFVVTP